MGVTKLTCKECGADYALEARYVCDRCFGPLEVQLRARHRRRRARAAPHPGRPAEHLALPRLPAAAGPAAAHPRTGLPAGCTPLIRADRLAARLGIREVWVKNDAANPTHSFKDRVVSVACRARSRARLRHAGLRLDRQPGQLGRRPRRRAGHATPTSSSPPTSRSRRSSRPASTARTWSRSRATTTTSTGCAPSSSGERDWAFVNVNVRPYYAEGSKTLAYEIAEQLGWETPDRVVAPIASGSLYTKIAKGFEEWRELGLVRGERADMNGAQAEGCSPVAAAFAAGADFCKPVRPDTIAKSLAIGNPADGPYALDLARRSGGGIDAVTDDEIRAGIRLLAETTGIFTETAGGVTTAVLAKLAERGDIDADERVVLVITGEGLKTLDAVRGTFEAFEIDALLRRVRRRGRGSRGARLMAYGQAAHPAARGRRRRRARSASTAPPSARCSTSLFDRHGELRDRLSDGDGGAAPLRQRLRRRRGHPLRRRAADPRRRRAGGADSARGRRRVTPGGRLAAPGVVLGPRRAEHAFGPASLPGTTIRTPSVTRFARL